MRMRRLTLRHPTRARQRWFGAACAMLAALSACQREPSASAAREGAPAAAVPAVAAAPSIVFLGDSLTAGYGLQADEALPALIERRVQEANLPFRVINAGRSGDTSAGGLARVDWYLKDSVDLRALVIGLGSNDAMRGLPLETLEDNLRKLIRRARERKPDAKIFLWALETFPNLGPEYAAAYAAVFPRLSKSEGVTLIPFPLEAVAGRPELNQADGIHPTAEGTRLVADLVWATLSAAL